MAGPARRAGARLAARRRAAGRPHASTTCCRWRGDYDLAVLHTSAPSFAHDVKVAEALREREPAPARRLRRRPRGRRARGGAGAPRRRSSSWPAPSSTSPSRRSPQGRPLDRGGGPVATAPTATSIARPSAPLLEDMDRLPFVVDVYKRDLEVERYFIGYLLHPYVSLYTGRGCRSKCTFCLWPQTVGGHRYRTRSVEHVVAEIAHAQPALPAGEGVLLRRRHLHRRPAARRGHRARARAARRDVVVQRQGRTCPYETLKVLKDNGLRLLLVGYESGNQAILNNIKKGIRIDRAREFTRERQGARHQDPRHVHHGAARRDARDDRGDDPLRAGHRPRHAPGVAGRAVSGHRALPRGARARLAAGRRASVDAGGVQTSVLGYPHLSRTEIFASLEQFYRRFYFRPAEDLRHRRRDGARPRGACGGGSARASSSCGSSRRRRARASALSDALTGARPRS